MAYEGAWRHGGFVSMWAVEEHNTRHP